MSSSSWNLDTYRRLSLSECHWRLCRRFMARYQHRFSEEQTVALAQIFANTQLLIKGDADKTMELVLDLVKDGESSKDTGTSVNVKREKESVENGVVKIEIDLDSSSMESIVKKEPEEDVKPFKRTHKKEPKEEDLEVDAEPKFKTHKLLEAEPESFNTLNEAGPSSHEDLPAAEVCSNCSSTGTFKTKQVKEHATPKSHSGILAGLTHFKPALDIEKIGDVYRNLVLFDKDFQKTREEFNELGCGFLAFSGYKLSSRQYRGRVYARQYMLTETWDTSMNQASEKAKTEFFRKMTAYCYQIVSKHPSHLRENQIARLEDPATNRKYYKKIIKKLKKDSIKQDLVFSAEFSESEQNDLRSIASKFGLATETFGLQRQLKVIGQPMPALAIVERVLVHKDPDLCELYEVIPPRKDDGRT